MSFLRRVFNRLAWLYRLYIKKDHYTCEVKRWKDDRGDLTLRFDYPFLDDKSIVIDLGGYFGDFAQNIAEKYNCYVYVFEPHPVFYKKCQDRFSENSKVSVFNYGLGARDEYINLIDAEDASSVFDGASPSDDRVLECKIRNIHSVLSELNFNVADLMKINIEGGEYELFEYLISTGGLGISRSYQVQFHNFIEECVERRRSITANLNKTHDLTWCYDFVWENWQTKG